MLRVTPNFTSFFLLDSKSSYYTLVIGHEFTTMDSIYGNNPKGCTISWEPNLMKQIYENR
jgi:hypothetical protein